SDRSTALHGTVSARGGPAGGSGGFIEVSGRGSVSYAGSADAGAQRGKSGTLLLDPKDVTISDAPAGVFPQFDLTDPHPSTGDTFASQMTVLSNGNVLVNNPTDNFGGLNAGAVDLFDGLSGALLSVLVGSHDNDQVGYDAAYGAPFRLLSNGNYLIRSPVWNGNLGAVTWASGSSGVSGIVSEANSLVGSNPKDEVGLYVTPLSNGNYVVASPYWNGTYPDGRGAVTWGNGSTGTGGVVSEANSLIGSSPGDRVGSYGITTLRNGNYVVDSPTWDGGRGAATWEE